MPPSPLLLLGGTGRVARLLKAAGLSGPGVFWLPHRQLDSLPPLPACATLVALWGRTGNAGPLRDNARLALRAQALAQRHGLRRVIHLSSAAVYGTLPAGRCHEGAAQPQSRYGQSKWLMEQALAQWQRRHRAGPECCILRLGNVAGADSLAPALADPAADDPVRLDRFADGRGPRRSYLGANDLARMLLWLARPDVPCPPCLNVAGPRPVAMEALLQAAGRHIAWHPAPPDALPEVALDGHRLARLFGTLEDSGTAEGLLAQIRLKAPA
ncbi:NAD(P)-dependent oxidoreductase [Pseudooceanicola sp. CBS1P-1]|uniref:NAD-dependent epimerase/dehydratase family protein n=1 Tax=Pseudooceanicola albus TaxID=2692189 RepID=A0A6L7G9R5_9RHOB|nr:MULTISPECIES: NAD(P)-dependent oxidoreductase [Pseudooceanicola]MBT9385808.1 NAD(P)-dependent oxidoreductase [Pseudooceanicola endophyticus]MXN20040.1 NAD-dependent epimerase/dehydratase family protein [Pseudooceanicola albus]